MRSPFFVQKPGKHAFFHACVHATESQDRGKKARSKVQTNIPLAGSLRGALLKIHRRLQQRRRCCPFVDIERDLSYISGFLFGDVSSYLSTLLLFRIWSYTLPLSPRGYEILWEPKRFTARAGSSTICFSFHLPLQRSRKSTRAGLKK